MPYRLTMFAESNPDKRIGDHYEFDAGDNAEATVIAQQHLVGVVGPDDLLGDIHEGDGEGRWNYVTTIDATHAEVTL